MVYAGEIPPGHIAVLTACLANQINADTPIHGHVNNLPANGSIARMAIAAILASGDGSVRIGNTMQCNWIQFSLRLMQYGNQYLFDGAHRRVNIPGGGDETLWTLDAAGNPDPAPVNAAVGLPDNTTNWTREHVIKLAWAHGFDKDREPGGRRTGDVVAMFEWIYERFRNAMGFLAPTPDPALAGGGGGGGGGAAALAAPAPNIIVNMPAPPRQQFESRRIKSLEKEILEKLREMRIDPKVTGQLRCVMDILQLLKQHDDGALNELFDSNGRPRIGSFALCLSADQNAELYTLREAQEARVPYDAAWIAANVTEIIDLGGSLIDISLSLSLGIFLSQSISLRVLAPEEGDRWGFPPGAAEAALSSDTTMFSKE